MATWAPRFGARVNLRARACATAAALISALLVTAGQATAQPVAAPLGPVELAPLATPPIARVRPIAVFGDDSRAPLTRPRARLASSIGLLFNNDAKTVCTAFCVGARTIATASHCLFGSGGRRRARLSEFRFSLKTAARQPETRLAGHASGTVAQHVISGAEGLRLAPPIDASEDWALARLEQPICRQGVLPIALRTPAEIETSARARDLTHVSYHRDFASWTLAEARDCYDREALDETSRAAIAQDFATPENLFLHHCDTGGASSGSPLLLEIAGVPHVVAINVGTYVQTRLMMRAGQVVHRFKADAIANTAVTTRTFAAALESFQAARIIATLSEMRQLQRRLSELGLYRGDIDGLYGPQTRRAIMAFERARGAAPTGLASRELMANIRNDDAAVRSSVTPELSAIEIRSNRPSGDHLGLRARE